MHLEHYCVNTSDLSSKERKICWADNLTTTPEEASWFFHAQKIAQSGRGVLFYGPSGAGKTFLLKTIANEHALINNIRSVFIDVNAIPYAASKQEIYNKAIEAPWLFLDGLGSTNYSTLSVDFESWLYAVLEARWSAGRPTFFGSIRQPKAGVLRGEDCGEVGIFALPTIVGRLLRAADAYLVESIKVSDNPVDKVKLYKQSLTKK